MTQEAQISCVTPDGVDADYRLDAVGGTYNQERWKISIDTAINHIETGKWRFFTFENGQRAEVVRKIHPQSGRKYLTTTPDGYAANNLCKLRSC